MFSFIKILDLCDKNITITFHGIYENYKNFLKKIDIRYISDLSIIHKENKEEFFVIICKEQTCSQKLKNLIDVKNYLKNLINV